MKPIEAMTERLRARDLAAAAVNDLAEEFDPGFMAGIHIVTGTWTCQVSPFGYCAYEHYADRAHDECIYCLKPEERK